MPEQIGDSIVSAIQEVDLSSSKAKDEKQLEPDEESLLLEAESEGEEISIQAVIIDGDVGPIERRVDDLEGLVENDPRINYINYEDIEGRVSVDNVSSANSSSIDNLRDFEISGKFLPYPKFFPNQKPILYLFPKSFLLKLGIDAEVSMLISLETIIDGELTLSSVLNNVSSLDSQLDFSLFSSAQLSRDTPIGGKTESELILSASSVILTYISGNISTFSELQGEILKGKLVEGNTDFELSIESSLIKSIILEAELISDLSFAGYLALETEYGFNYGSDYGSYIEGYTANYGIEYGG